MICQIRVSSYFRIANASPSFFWSNRMYVTNAASGPNIRTYENVMWRFVQFAYFRLDNVHLSNVVITGFAPPIEKPFVEFHPFDKAPFGFRLEARYVIRAEDWVSFVIWSIDRIQELLIQSQNFFLFSHGPGTLGRGADQVRTITMASEFPKGRVQGKVVFGTGGKRTWSAKWKQHVIEELSLPFDVTATYDTVVTSSSLMPINQRIKCAAVREFVVPFENFVSLRLEQFTYTLKSVRPRLLTTLLFVCFVSCVKRFSVAYCDRFFERVMIDNFDQVESRVCVWS